MPYRWLAVQWSEGLLFQIQALPHNMLNHYLLNISKQSDMLIIILKSNRIFLMKEVRGKFRAYGKV